MCNIPEFYQGIIAVITAASVAIVGVYAAIKFIQALSS